MAKEKANAAAPPAPAAPETESDLRQLREILYGNQAREMEDRLTRLESRLEAIRQELTTTIRDKVGKLDRSTGEAIKKTRVELVTVVEQKSEAQSSDLGGLREEINARLQQTADGQGEALKRVEKALGARVDALREEALEELASTRDSLQEELRRGMADLTERLLQFQKDSRQRDDDLRQELLSLTGWLDERKTGRLDLGQLLIDAGKALHSGLPEVEGADQEPEPAKAKA